MSITPKMKNRDRGNNLSGFRLLHDIQNNNNSTNNNNSMTSHSNHSHLIINNNNNNNNPNQTFDTLYQQSPPITTTPITTIITDINTNPNTIITDNNTNINTNTNTHANTHANSNTNTNANANAHANTHANTNANTHANANTNIHANANTHAHTHTNTHADTNAHTNIHADTNVNTNTHTNTNTKMLPMQNESKLTKILLHDKRTDEEARIIFEKIKEFEFFNKFYQNNKLEKLEEDALIYLCKRMKYEKHPAGTFIFNEGDPSNGKVYIVYSGCVLVIIKEDRNVYVKENIEMRKRAESNMKKANNNENIQNKIVRELTKNLNMSMANSIIITNAGGSNVGGNANINGGINNPILPTTTTTTTTTSNKSKLLSKKLKAYVKVVGQFNQINHNNHQLRGGINTKLQHRNSIFSQHQNDTSHTDGQGTGGGIGGTPTHSFNDELNLDVDSNVESLVKQAGTLKDKIDSGKIFGEKALTANTLRSASILTNTECEFLVITAQDFHMVKERFDKTKTIKKDFLLKNFPDLQNVNSENIIDGYLYNLRDEVYMIDSIIIEEGKIGENLYIIFEGYCELSKQIIFKGNSNDNNKKIPTSPKNISPFKADKKRIPICRIGPGTFFGEEILNDIDSNHGLYEYTIRATSSKINLCSIKKKILMQRFPPGCVSGIKDIYAKKKMTNEQLLLNLIQNHYKNIVLDIEVDAIQLDNILNSFEPYNPKKLLKAKDSNLESQHSPSSHLHHHPHLFHHPRHHHHLLFHQLQQQAQPQNQQQHQGKIKIPLKEYQSLITNEPIVILPSKRFNDSEFYKEQIKPFYQHEGNLGSQKQLLLLSKSDLDEEGTNTNTNTNNNNNTTTHAHAHELKNMHLKLNNRSELLHKDEHFQYGSYRDFHKQKKPSNIEKIKSQIKGYYEEKTKMPYLQHHIEGSESHPLESFELTSDPTRSTKAKQSHLTKINSIPTMSTTTAMINTANTVAMATTAMPTMVTMANTTTITTTNTAVAANPTIATLTNTTNAIIHHGNANALSAERKTKTSKHLDTCIMADDSCISEITKSKTMLLRNKTGKLRDLNGNVDEKGQKRDEAYLTELGNFKIDLGIIDENSTKKDKIFDIRRGFAIPTSIEPPHFNLEKSLRLKHDKIKKFYQKKFNHVTLNINNNNNNSMTSIMDQGNSNLDYDANQALRNNTQRYSTQSNDIKQYLAKTKSSGFKNLKLNIGSTTLDPNNLPKDIHLTSPLSTKSTRFSQSSSQQQIRPTTTTTTHNHIDLITPERILAWKHRNYLSLTSRHKEKSITFNEQNTTKNRILSTGSGLAKNLRNISP